MTNTCANLTPQQIHKWYLESIKHISKENYNPKAGKPYDELTKEQQFIDVYIADKINEHIKSSSKEVKDE